MKFPKMHIAASVVNRILNAKDEIEAGRMTSEPTEPTIPPSVPDPAMEGAQLDLNLAQPTPPMAGPEIAEEDLTSTVLAGDDLASLL